MSDRLQQLKRPQIRAVLAQWEEEKEVIGAYIVTLVEQGSYEMEIRKSGTVPGFSPVQFRSILERALSEAAPSWDNHPEGLGFSLKFQDEVLGFCVIFPWSDIAPQGRWEKDVAQLAIRLGPLYAGSTEAAPSLEELAEAIPERLDPPEEDANKKLHWEASAARVEVPVQADLAQHLLLDHMPLF